MRPADMGVTKEALRGFYPTPSALAEKMLEDVNWNCIQCVLEPSAGKGDLVRSSQEIKWI